MNFGLRRSGVSTSTAVVAVVISFLVGVGGTYVVTSSLSSGRTTTVVGTSTVTQTVTSNNSEQALYQQALKEGALTIYGSMDADQFVFLQHAFSAQYPGITVNYVSLNPPQAYTRITSELQAQNYSADLMLSSTPTLYTMELQGYIQKYVSPEASAFPSIALDPLNGTTPMMELSIGWWYDSNLVSSSQVPTTFAGLSAAQYKGQIELNDPTTGSTYTQYWAALAGILGNSTVLNFLQTLETNTSPTVISAFASCANDVASGTHAFCLGGFMQDAAPDIQGGAALKYLPMPNLPIMVETSNLGIIAHAKDPAAAKLFVDFASSPIGQLTIGNINVRTPVSRTVNATWSEVNVINHFAPGATLAYFPSVSIAQNSQAWGALFKSMGY
jgi:iron(III) transport system substrate-binding protein